MIFLIEYDRPTGRIINIEEFEDKKRLNAEEKRIKTELDLRHKLLNYEVVLLDAANEAALRKTHRRYFQELNQINKSIEDNTSS